MADDFKSDADKAKQLKAALLAQLKLPWDDAGEADHGEPVDDPLREVGCHSPVVYMITLPGSPHVKIGTTTDLAGRIATFCTPVADDWIVLNVIEGGKRVETQIHTRFRKHRVRPDRELFMLEPIRAAIMKMRGVDPSHSAWRGLDCPEQLTIEECDTRRRIEGRGGPLCAGIREFSEQEKLALIAPAVAAGEAGARAQVIRRELESQASHLIFVAVGSFPHIDYWHGWSDDQVRLIVVMTFDPGLRERGNSEFVHGYFDGLVREFYPRAHTGT